MNLSLRIRLIGAFLVVIVTAGAITTVVGVHMVTRTIDDLGLNEARHDLSSARAIYQNELNSVLDSVRHTARRFFVRDALAGVGNIDSAAAELSRVRQREGLDILTVTDSRGTVFVRTRNPSVKGDTQAADVLIQKAMAG
jgi:pyruvate/2-oxoglutarate/acetoin dehydrogenase E1 component